MASKAPRARRPLPPPGSRYSAARSLRGRPRPPHREGRSCTTSLQEADAFSGAEQEEPRVPTADTAVTAQRIKRSSHSGTEPKTNLPLQGRRSAAFLRVSNFKLLLSTTAYSF